MYKAKSHKDAGVSQESVPSVLESYTNYMNPMYVN